MSGRYLLIDGMDEWETERFFYYISYWRLPQYVRRMSLQDMGVWLFRKMKTKKPWKVGKLYNTQLSDDPWGYIKMNGGYLV